MSATNTVQKLIKKMNEAGVPKEKQDIYLGQFKKETGGFRSITEDLRYTTLAALRKSFSMFRNMPDAEAKTYLKNPKKLANAVYDDANRTASRKLGNTEEGDGYKYRGRGYIQVTGRDNYKKLSKLLFGDENVLLDDPDILSNPEYGADASIAWLNAKTQGLNTADEISNVVNSGESAEKKAERKAFAEAFTKQRKLADAGVEIAVDGDWGKNSKELWSKYGNAIDPSQPSVTSPDIEPEGIPSPLERRMQFAQVDPRRVDLAPQMAQAPTPQEAQYATMEDLLADRDLMGRSSFA